jgi:hypothetical protein
MKKAFALAVAVMLVAPLLAWGWGFRRGRTAVSYYYPAYPPAVSYYYPAYAPAVSYYYPAYAPAVNHYYPAYAPAVSYYYPSYAPAVSYYYPAPTYVTPVAPACVTPTYTVPSTQAPPLLPDYAVPSAAPPSRTQTSQTSLSPQSDRGNGALSYYDTYSVARRDPAQPVGNLSEVAFWNLTDRDLTLQVDGQTRAVPRGKSLPLTLGREFVWQIDGREPKRQTLGKDQTALDIVIRR